MADYASARGARTLMYALDGLAGLLLVLGLLLGKRGDQGINTIPRWVRMSSSALVLLGALLQARAGPPGQRRLTAAGMGCGFAGDLIMAELTGLPEHVLFGMLAFGAGHGCYIQAFAARARQLAAAPRAERAALPLAWLVGLLGWLVLVRNPAISAALNYAALAYALLLASMAGAAAALAARDRRYAGVAAGGALFLASDLILAARLFRQAHFTQIGDVVWLTYITGQALIVAGMAAEPPPAAA